MTNILLSGDLNVFDKFPLSFSYFLCYSIVAKLDYICNFAHFQQLVLLVPNWNKANVASGKFIDLYDLFGRTIIVSG